MDIYDLAYFSSKQCPMNSRLFLYHGLTLKSVRYNAPAIAIDCYDYDVGEFDIDDYERSRKYIAINDRSKKGWKDAYRQARIIKSSVVSKMSGDKDGF